MTPSLDAVEQALEGWRDERPFVLGLCGAQGSGKSTLSEGLAHRLNGRGIRTAILSLDDLYLSHDKRAELAQDIHPLLAVRGVPGTHDVAHGLRLLEDVRAGRVVTLPRFDKASDDPFPDVEWAHLNTPLDVLIFEGWCVGAKAQDEDVLRLPVNDLEAARDADGVWRRHVNDALKGVYAELFAQMDRLVLLAAPGFEVVEGWRRQQEAALRAKAPEGGRIMSDAEISLFIQHYERLTRHILSTMPSYADLTLYLDAQRHLKDHK